MKLKLVAFGKLKTPGLREAADYYKKLISPWVSVDETELKPVPVLDKSSPSIQVVQEKETEILFATLNRNETRKQILLLDEKGKANSTAEWAARIEDWRRSGLVELVFCIGSSFGFSEAAKKKAHGTLSLSSQTLSHELSRVVLLEQLYRAWSVVKGHPYHHNSL